MKILSFLSLLLLFTLSVNAQTSVSAAIGTAPESPAIVWNQTTHEFGDIQQNVPVTAEFTLTNNSDDILVITDVKAGCGCTTTNYQKEPLHPGESTTIKATYNAQKEGAFTKTVKVFTSATAEAIPLTLKGAVIKA
jgi:Protein of unknown function (DUF1573)